jgi:hypothetical protein
MAKIAKEIEGVIGFGTSLREIAHDVLPSIIDIYHGGRSLMIRVRMGIRMVVWLETSTGSFRVLAVCRKHLIGERCFRLCLMRAEISQISFVWSGRD